MCVVNQRSLTTMARERFCDVCRGWHPLDEPWPAGCVREVINTRSDLTAPMLSLDTMDPVQSQTDGKMYDSKSNLRRTYKEGGVIEVGDDPSILDPKPFKRKRVTREDVRPSVEKALSRAGFGA